MIESKTHFTIEKNDRKYILICDPNSPLGELHDVICQIKGEVVNKIQEVMKMENPSEDKKEQVDDDKQAEC